MHVLRTRVRLKHTGFTQVSLAEDHTVSSYTDIEEVKCALSSQMPELQTFFSSGSLVDGVLNMGAPAQIDIRIAGNDMTADFQTRSHRSEGKADSWRGRRIQPPGHRLPLSASQSIARVPMSLD